MPDPSFENLGRKLLWRGFSAAYVRRTTRELREHWEDLREAALEQGCSPEEAGARANAQLGDADDLARELSARMRNASWVGRHRVFNFCLLPLLALILWWALFMLALGWSSGAFAWTEGSGSRAPDWAVLQLSLQWCQWAGGMVLPVGFAWLARRTHSGIGWGLAATAVLSLHNGFHFVKLTPPGAVDAGFVMGYTVSTNFLSWNHPALALPLLAFVIFVYGGLKLEFRNLGQTL